MRWRLVAAVALLTAGCAGPAPVAGPPTPSTAARYPLGLQRYAPAARAPLPVVAGTTLDGVRLSTASLRGHVVVLTVWASWCAPCREESTVLAKLASAARPHGIRVLGLDENDTTEQATAFAHRAGAEYPSLVDDGTRMRALTRWLPPAVPGTLVVDPRGRVAARVVGAVRAGVLDPVLADLSRG